MILWNGAIKQGAARGTQRDDVGNSALIDVSLLGRYLAGPVRNSVVASGTAKNSHLQRVKKPITWCCSYQFTPISHYPLNRGLCFPLPRFLSETIHGTQEFCNLAPVRDGIGRVTPVLEGVPITLRRARRGAAVHSA
jgi:hypothetical protein